MDKIEKKRCIVFFVFRTARCYIFFLGFNVCFLLFFFRELSNVINMLQCVVCISLFVSYIVRVCLVIGFFYFSLQCCFSYGCFVL